LEKDENLALMLRNPVRRKIVLHYLKNGNSWSSISSLASSIRESKATVQDHLEVMKGVLMAERWFMNRRLFRIRPELFPAMAPDALIVAGITIVLGLSVVYVLRPDDIVAGMLAGVVLMLMVYVAMRTK